MKSLQEVYSSGTSEFGNVPAEYTDKGTTHSYIETYQQIFDKFPDSIRILEIGIHAGGSLLLWSSYLTNQYEIWGIDIEPNFWPDRPYQKNIIENPNIHTLFGRNSKSPDSYRDIPGEFDLIIDDGHHHQDSQLATFFAAWPKLKAGGVYLIEDIQSEDLVGYVLSKIQEQIPDVKFEIHFGKKQYDDNILKLFK